MANTSDTLNVDRLMKVLSQILSEKYGCQITMTARLKDEYAAEKAQAEEKVEDTVSKAG